MLAGEFRLGSRSMEMTSRKDSGFRVQGLGFRVWGLGFRARAGRACRILQRFRVTGCFTMNEVQGLGPGKTIKTWSTSLVGKGHSSADRLGG